MFDLKFCSMFSFVPLVIFSCILYVLLCAGNASFGYGAAYPYICFRNQIYTSEISSGTLLDQMNIVKKWNLLKKLTTKEQKLKSFPSVSFFVQLDDFIMPLMLFF